jgi:uncharacterized protein YrzB (UPF0473 family)
MGAYSTLTISRETAIERILSLIDEASNEELADALFALTASKTGYNYCVEEKEDLTC